MGKKAKSDELSRRDRNRLIEWGGKFLRTVSTNPEVMRQMVQGGYSLEANRQGWKLYVSMMGGGDGRSEHEHEVVSAAYDQANARFADHVEVLRRARPLVAHYHPDLADRLFHKDIWSRRWDEAKLRFFLLAFERPSKALPNQPHPRDELRQVLQMLEKHGLLTRTRLAEMKADLNDSGKRRTEKVLMPCRSEDLEPAAKAFQTWLAEWRFIAQQHVTRRDHRILLGVSRPRPALGKEKKTDPQPVDA